MEKQNEIAERLQDIVQNQTSFLSPVVHEIFIDKVQQTTLQNYHVDNYVNWNMLTTMLQEDEERKLPPTLRTERWYRHHTQLLTPFLLSTHTKMFSYTEIEYKKMMELTRWMKQAYTLETCFNLWASYKKTLSQLNLHECVLLITAALERSLGNLFIYASGGRKPVPSLLRDLLGTEELFQLLGETPIITLQILMGSPLSFNLRNLMWHGFVGLGELNQVYASTLLSICAAMGQKLVEDNIEVIEYLAIEDDSVVPRPWICFPQTQILLEISPLLDIDEEYRKGRESLSLLVSQSQAIPNSMRYIWMGAIECYCQGNYGRCCALLVPQMELLLRLMFCAANQCPDRVLTAESTVLYTTLDVILAENIQSEECFSNRPNKVKELLGNGLYWALRDMFTLPEGPRVRDRLSHAECRLTDVDVVLANHLLYLSKSLLLRVLSDAPVSNLGRQGEMENIFPQFHPTSIFKRELSSALSAVDTWISDLATLFKSHDDSQSCDITSLEKAISNSELLRLLQSFEFPAPIIPILLNWMHKPLNANRVSSQEIVSHFDAQILNRVIENLCIYRQIARRVQTVVQLITESIRNYGNQPKSVIRSRRRLTFSRLLNYCPLYITALQLALLYPISLVVAGDYHESAAAHTDKRKLLRNAASFVDKAASLSHSHKNRWLELAQCANRFLCQHSVLFDQYNNSD